MEKRLAVLAEASARIVSANSLRETLRFVTEEARRIIGAHRSVTSLTAGEDWSQALQFVSLSDKYAARRDYSEKPTGAGIYALVCRENRPMRLTQAELKAHPAWRDFAAARSRHPPMRGWLAAPMVGRDGKSLGLVQLSDKCEGEFDACDEAILVQLARLSASAIENKRLVEAAQTAEQRFRDFACHGSDILWETDANHRYTHVSASIDSPIQPHIPDILGKTRWEYLGVDANDPYWQRHIADLAARRPFRDLEYTTNKHGNRLSILSVSGWPIFDTGGTFVGYRGVTRDVTALRTAKAEAKANELRFVEFAELGSDVLWETDERHRYTFVSVRPGQFTARPLDAIYGKTRWQAFSSDPTDPKWAAHIADLEAHRPFRDFEYSIQGPGGGIQYRRASGRPIFDADGKFRGYRGTVSDITALREAETRAHEAGARYRNIVETANDGLWLLDSEMRVEFVNRRVGEILGYGIDELIGRPVTNFLPAELHDDLRRKWEERRAGKSARFETRFRRKDGSEIWALVSATPRRDAAGAFAGSTAAFIDISDRKQAEAALRDSESRFRDFAQIGSDWLWESDAEHRCTFMDGPPPVARDFALGKRRWEYGGVDANAPEWQRHRRDLALRLPFHNFEYRIEAESGEPRLFSVNGKPIFDAGGTFLGYRGTTRDITAQREAESKLRLSEQRFKDFAEIASDWIWETDTEHRFRFIAGQSGNPAERGLGLTIWELAGASAEDPFWREHVAAIKARKPFRDIEFTLRSRSGRRLHLAASGRPFFDEHGSFLGYRGTTTNRTREREAEAAAREASERYRQIVETTHEGIWLIGADWNTSYVNPRLAEMLGYEPREIIGRPHWDFLVPEERPRAIALVEGRARQGVQRREWRYRRKDGTTICTLVSSKPFVGADGALAGIIGMLIDITDRKQAEEAAARAKRELDAILARTSDGVAVFDNEWRFTYINPPGERIFGFSAADAIGRNGFETYGSATNNIFLDAYKQAKRDGTPLSFSAYSAFLKAWHEVRAFPIADGITTYFRDISSDRAAHLAVIEGERKLRAALESNQSILASISEGFVAFDNEWRFTYVNHAAEKMWRVKAEDFLGKTVGEALNVGPDNVFLARYLESKASGDPIAFTAYSRIFGMWLEVRGSPHPGGYTIYFRDVSEERRSHLARLEIQRNLEAAREINQRIFETSLDIICTSDRLGNMTQVNPGMALTLGYAVEQLVGRSARDITHPEDVEVARAALRAAKRTRTQQTFECRSLRSDGRPVWINWAVTWSEPEQTFLYIGRDLTERMQAQERLARSQKLEAIGQLTGGIAHDFNNLLTVIMGSADMLVEGLGDRAALRRQAELSLRAAKRAAELTAQLLAFARRQALTAETIAVDKLVEGMHELLKRTLGVQIEIEVRAEPGLWHCKADATQLETALLNLALNARDAMPDGGRLAIRAVNRTMSPEASEPAAELAPGDYVVIEVSDTGIGMTPEVMARAFEPFFTTKDVGKGSGLGLAMVYGFVKQSGGHIAVESRVGKGTKFRLLLPRDASAAPASPSVPRSAAEAVPRGGEKILVVEDDAGVRDIVVKQLNSLGYSVEVAKNGVEARGILGGSAAIDLLFTDIMMPGGISGRQLAVEARTLRPGLRVLFTTGYADASVATALGEPTPILRKPYRTSDLARAIRRVLDRAA